MELNSFVENGFLKTLFDKSPQAMDKAQLLVEISSNMKTTPNPVLETPPILPDVEMTPVDQSVIPKTSQKKDKQKKHKLKAQNTLNKKSEIAGQSSNSNQPKKKNKKSSTKIAKDDNQSKNLNSQKKAKKSLKSKRRNNVNHEILAEILNLLCRLDYIIGHIY
ncbi:hypothetical protein RhiirB3_434783 [Rhizophagus irregularis]|nr:hypothetical protein RhiirB3_434783 [Rhizophagus irregularis]